MTDFQFSNLCGTVYSCGNILFTERNPSFSTGESSTKDQILLSPVGNKLTMFDLTNNVSRTLPFQNRSNIDRVVLSPDGKILITVDVDGFALIINYQKQVVIAHFNFRDHVTALTFTPDSKFFAVATGKKLKIFESPDVTHKTFSPLVLYKKYANLHSDDITGISWSTDSRLFLTYSDDLTVKMMSLHKIKDFLPFTFSGNNRKIVSAFFSQDNSRIFTVSQNGVVLLWQWTDERGEGAQKQMEFAQFKSQKRLKVGGKPNEYVQSETDVSLMTELERKITSGRFLLEKKHRFTLQAQSRITSVDQVNQGDNKLLCVGQSNGVFSLFNLDTLESIHSFQISEQKIDTISINANGDWIALGSRMEGQLFVWEWKSESYVLKQQGHFFDMNCLSYSPDGVYLATGGNDGKLKCWTTKNSLCFTTFTDHEGEITDIKFMPKKGNAILSSSVDGTVRAFDLVRYKNFRTMKPNKHTQLMCLAIEAGGDIVCAGSSDPFNIFVWSLKTGQLVDIMSGHTGPVASLCFSPSNGLLVSGSWDQSVRVWDVFGKNGQVDTFEHNAEVLHVAFHPNSNDILATTLGGSIYVWDQEASGIKGMIECKQDLLGGRLRDDRQASKNSTKNKHFNSIDISPNGEFVLGGGNSKNICLYDIKNKIMLRRYAITQNRSLDGVLLKLNSKNIKGDVADHELDIDSDLEEDAWQVRQAADSAMPGAKQKDNANVIKRSTKLAIRVKKIQFSPDGTQFACVTTEGLLIYSLAQDLLNQTTFNPYEIDETVTIDNIINHIKSENYLSALIMAMRLNEEEVIEKVFKCVPIESVTLISANFPSNYLFKFLEFLQRQIAKSQDIEWNMIWLKELIKYNEHVLKGCRQGTAYSSQAFSMNQLQNMASVSQNMQGRAILLKLYQTIAFFDQSFKKIVNENLHLMTYMEKAAISRQNDEQEGMENTKDNSD